MNIFETFLGRIGHNGPSAIKMGVELGEREHLYTFEPALEKDLNIEITMQVVTKVPGIKAIAWRGAEEADLRIRYERGTDTAALARAVRDVVQAATGRSVFATI